MKAIVITRELIDLRASILEGRYTDALAIVDELEGISKQAILRHIESFLVRLLIHLIKNQVEQRLTNSWVASISDAVRQIQKLNLKDNKTSHYIKQGKWQPFFEEALAGAIRPASVEVMNGVYRPPQLSQMIDKPQIISTAKLIDLTYIYPAATLLEVIDTCLIQLSGAKDWQGGN